MEYTPTTHEASLHTIAQVIRPISLTARDGVYLMYDILEV